jgi:hypothetical protein
LTNLDSNDDDQLFEFLSEHFIYGVRFEYLKGKSLLHGYINALNTRRKIFGGVVYLDMSNITVPNFD